MLKPKRKITKKEIKQDPLLEIVYKGQYFITENKKLLTRITGGIIALVILILLIQNNRSNSESEANSLMASAMSHYQSGNYSLAVSDLYSLIDEYESTESGERALFYLAQVKLASGDSEEVKQYASEYINKGKSLSHRSGAHLLLAEMNEKEGDYGSAAINYLKASETAITEIAVNRNLLSAASSLLENREFEKAGEIISNLDTSNGSLDVLKADLSRIKAKLRQIRRD